MKRRAWIVAVAVGALALVGCTDRLERRNVDGVDCIITKNGFGRPQYTDCDWGQR